MADHTSNEAARQWAENKRLHGIADPTPEEIAREEMLRGLENWPWDGLPDRLVMLAPYAVNHFHKFLLPSEVQTAPIFKALRIPELRASLLRSVYLYHQAISAFAATSQECLRMVESDVNIWDVANGDSCGCDIKLDSPWLEIHREKMRTEKSASGLPLTFTEKRMGIVPVVGPNLVITPVRSDRGDISYAEQLLNLGKLTLGLSNYAGSLRNVQFHRVQLLTIDLLGLVVPYLNNLENLGIYNCLLLSFRDTIPLLRIVRSPRCKGKRVTLDFFPSFHVGPIPIPGGDNYSGPYGATWDNPEIDTRLAIWKMVPRIIQQARHQGVDFESTYSAFRQWLEWGPCWRVGKTLEMLGDSKASDEEIVAQVAYNVYRGDVERLHVKLRNRPEGSAWYAPIYVYGRKNNNQTIRTTKRYFCSGCRENVLGIFYDYPQVRQATACAQFTTILCLGCKLDWHLLSENDHYKHGKRKLVDAWMGRGLPVRESLLSDIFSKPFLDNGLHWAGRLDNRRALHLARGVDKEKRERQRSLAYLRAGKLGRHELISPTIETKDQDLKDSKWNVWRWERLRAHRRF
ncbi:hypothetical protein BP6252_07058 [Coleophoma cylindrospora]|uniref:Uncharacterized protein n=1 Tax=Coleophoma cylindrospora TaxID=1849047 RepID=A0A3D8RH14_9HELO|nr:hypothetical protein BP6252_07058 [Coleophoma cylindrospora]